MIKTSVESKYQGDGGQWHVVVGEAFQVLLEITVFLGLGISEPALGISAKSYSNCYFF